ncbi:type 1 glutamine amidotransferase domain-containing protein [Mesorhizobium sp. M0976]|uniref:type 1 glutamine amidotransferase domain-containing protein n=1 Tax=unclassified Mesorhizobium TaxID=325217 RepID=UPI003337C5B1
MTIEFYRSGSPAFLPATVNKNRRELMPNVLIVLSAADTWTRADGTAYESGVWAEEFVVLDEKFIKAGFHVDIATPGGVTPTMDARSMDPAVVGQDHVDHFRSYLNNNADRVEAPLILGDVDVSRYDAIVIPGGHGPVEDLYKDPDMGRILVEANRASKIIAPVCHGQAALLAAKDENGQWPFSGRKMTSFSDEEEIEFGTAANAPWLLADTLRKSGALYEKGPNWGAFIVKDGNLMTGQNPASTAPLADAVIAVLG